MKQLVNEVRAVFGGEELVFRLPRERLPMLEFAMRRPAIQILRDVTHGNASVFDLVSVLEAAAPRGWGSAGAASNIGPMARSHIAGLYRDTPSSKVDKVLRENPPGRYFVLAQGVLTAALYGLPSEVATFDENEEPDDEA